MRKIAEIRNDISAMVEKVKTLNAAENAEELKKSLDTLDALQLELRAANEAEAAEQLIAERKLDNAQKKAGRSFSLVKFIREISEPRGQLTGLEAEVAEMGAEEYRRLGLTQNGFVIPSAMLRANAGQNYTTAADGGNLKEQMAARYVDVLKENLPIAKLGATILTDLVGTVPVVSSAQIAAGWLAEGAQGSVTKAAYAKATMTPHRNFVRVAFSKDLLRQTSFDVEADLMNRISEAHANLIEAAAIKGSGSSNQPSGILTVLQAQTNTPHIVAGGATGAAISWANVVALETKVAAENGIRGNCGYLTNAKVIGDMKASERTSTNGRYMLDGDAKNLNGYPIEMTNLVPSNLTKSTGSNLSAMIFGNWKDLYIGQWGGIDIVVDPYSRADYADVVITLNAWNDVLVAEPKSFAAIVDISTTA